ncbi:hypothetical protein COJ07_29175 [Bacillus cereus]|uniref:hypothetical protein n=1 Tax=Bacillus cereus TaxID=1396 RepID=UPI000BF619CE|nr:hypothetical protein [Bacillus cereus]PFL13996.1 hypothetical protein COJ07_29175 [Bacillus cereus]
MKIDATTLNTLIAVSGTLIGALFGAIATVIGTKKIQKDKDKKYNRQVELIYQESLSRMNVYISHMAEETYEDFLLNLEGRISGLKAIENLLSEFPLGTISTKQVFAVYRIRENLQEMIFDISLFQGNNIRVQQFESDAQFQMSLGANEDIKKMLTKKIELMQKNLKDDYNSRLHKNIKEYVESINVLKVHYHTIAQEIYEKNI